MCRPTVDVAPAGPPTEEQEPAQASPIDQAPGAQEEEPELLDTNDDGWSLTNAHHFGEGLANFLGKAEYHYRVVQIRGSANYGFKIGERRKGAAEECYTNGTEITKRLDGVRLRVRTTPFL